MSSRHKGPNPIIPIITPGAVAALGTALALFALFAHSAHAQTEDLVLETSEGTISIEFFDHGDIAEHIAEFRRRHPARSQVAFHRSDVTACPAGDLDCFFFCECVDLHGVCSRDEGDEVERLCDPIGETFEIDGVPCECKAEPIINEAFCFDDERPCDPELAGTTYLLDEVSCQCIGEFGLFCKDDESRTCEPVGDSYWIRDVDGEDGERVASPALYPSPFEVDDHNHVEKPADWMAMKSEDFRTQTGVWVNHPLTVAFERRCLGDPAACEADTCEGVGLAYELSGEWILNLGNVPRESQLGDDCPEKAHLVLGRFFDPVGALETIASYRTFNASGVPAIVADLMAADAAEFDQVPVVDSFSGEETTFIDPCDEGDVDYPNCAMPECLEPSANGEGCDDPRCLELVVEDGDPVLRCSGPVLPSFPLLVPEPASLWLQGAGLLTLAALAAGRRVAGPRS